MKPVRANKNVSLGGTPTNVMSNELLASTSETSLTRRDVISLAGTGLIGLLATGGSSPAHAKKTASYRHDGTQSSTSAPAASVSRPLAQDAVDPKQLLFQPVLERMADQWRSKYHLPGVWCAYIKDGHLVACVASGVKNIETGAPASIDDHVNIGSVSKVVSGTMIAEFVAKGAITFDTSVQDVYPELARQHPDSPLLRATMRQLMSHTAGLPKGPDISFDQSGIDYRRNTLKYYLESKDVRTPGTAYIYSNQGTPIAVSLTERLASSDFESWLYGSVGLSIGITNSHQVDTDADDVLPYYLSQDNRLRPGKMGDKKKRAFAPQGACSLTLVDICRFIQYFMANSTNLPRQTFDEMTHRVSESLHSDTSIGWHVASTGYVWKGGDTARGEVCIVRADPKTQTGAVMYWNANVQPPTPDLASPNIQGDFARLIYHGDAALKGL